MSRLLALTRGVSPALARCELTHQPRVPIDVGLAAAQHAAYEAALAGLGWEVQRLAADPDLPDSVFIEDTAVVLDDIVIIARPGAESRRAETPAVEETLKHHRLLGHIDPPGTLDGGDVLVAGRTIFVGQSTRTNHYGIAQFKAIAEYFGYPVRVVPVGAGWLHFKSAATCLADDVLLVNRAGLDTGLLSGFDLVDVDPAEPRAANVSRAGERLLASAAFPRTQEIIERRGFAVTPVNLSELAKAEGGVTCCSLLIRI